MVMRSGRDSIAQKPSLNPVAIPRTHGVAMDTRGISNTDGQVVDVELAGRRPAATRPPAAGQRGSRPARPRARSCTASRRWPTPSRKRCAGRSDETAMQPSRRPAWAMLAGMAVSSGVDVVQFLLPLADPALPAAGLVGCLVVDGIDQSVFQWFGYDPPGYQSYDKAMDVWYLAIAYLATLRNWAALPAYRVGQLPVLLPAGRAS